MDELFQTSPIAGWVNLIVSVLMLVAGFIFLVLCGITLIRELRGKNEAAKGNKMLTYSVTGFILLCASRFLAQYPFPNLKSVFLLLVLLLLFNLVVFVHESGHYLAARFFKAKVDEFAIGRGKVLFGFTRGNTTFNLRLLPLGGFVKINDEDFPKLRLIPRVIFFLAGVTFNFLSFVIAAGCISKYGFWHGVQAALLKIPSMFISIVTGIRLSDLYSPEKDLVGQWHTVATFTDLAQTPLITFAGISLLLGIINLIPVPIFDGGRVVLAVLEKICLLAGVPKEWVHRGTLGLLWAGLAFYGSPMIINNIWSTGARFGFNLVESLLWYALLFTIMMNIVIFFQNRKNKKIPT